jgi:hypothetical protein
VFSLRTLACWAGSAVVLTWFVIAQGRSSLPLIPQRLLGHRQVFTVNAIGFLVGGSIFIPTLVIPLMVEAAPSIVGDGTATSPLRASLTYLLPGAFASIIGAPVGAKLCALSGTGRALIASGFVTACGFAVPLVGPTVPADLIVGYMLISVGITMAYAAMPQVLAAAVSHDDIGVANSFNSLARWIGGAVFTAVCAAVLATASHTAPTEHAVRIVFAIGVGVGLSIAGCAVVVLSLANAAKCTAKVPLAETGSRILR